MVFIYSSHHLLQTEEGTAVVKATTERSNKFPACDYILKRGLHFLVAAQKFPRGGTAHCNKHTGRYLNNSALFLDCVLEGDMKTQSAAAFKQC